MTELPLLNPNGQLLPEVEAKLAAAKKTKSLWARRMEHDQAVHTTEGTVQAKAGDYLCRGVKGENWPQKHAKLVDKYSPTDEVDADGWQRFEPKPDGAPVDAAAIPYAFRIVAQWGELRGHAHDYVVRSQTDTADVWIVSKAVFEATYEIC